MIGLYDDGRVVDVKTDKRTFVMNASGKDSFVMRRDGKLSEVVCKSGDWIEIPPDSVCPRAAAIALGGSAEGYVAIDHPNIVHSRYLPTDACLRSIRAGTN